MLGSVWEGFYFFCAVSVDLISLVLLLCHSTTNTNTIHFSALSCWKMAAIIPSDVHCACHRNLNTHTQTHQHSCWPRTQTCTHTYAHAHLNKHVHRPRNAHTHHQSPFFSASTAVSCCPLHASHILSLFLSFPHTLACMGMCRLTPTNVTSAICAAQRITATHVFHFYTPKLASFFRYFHPFMPMKIRPVVWMETVLFHTYQGGDEMRWGNTTAFTSCARALQTLPANDFNRSS